METLRKNKTVLTDILSADSSYILQHVEQCGLITKREYNMLHDSNKSNWDTIVLLLDKLRDKDDNTCKVFLDLLQKTDIVETYPKLKEVFNQKNNSSLSDCSPGPALVLSVPFTDVSNPEASVPGGDEVHLYDMSSIPCGLCLIINNKNFDNCNVRNGTDKDALDLAKVFTRLKFSVFMCKDRTGVEMKQVLKVFSELGQLSDLQSHDVKEWVGGQFAELKELPKHGDAFVCCILSHGTKEGVLGTDGTVVRTLDIQLPFDGRNCGMLLQKPKLFFIQACRGPDLQEAVPVNKKPRVEEMDTLLKTDDVTVQEHTHPVYADFLIFMANVEDYRSFRHTVYGSWFIQSLCSQLEKSCTRGQDIHEILVAVKAEVSKKECNYPVKDADGDYSYKLVKQSPQVIDTLTKKLVFPAETMPTY